MSINRGRGRGRGRGIYLKQIQSQESVPTIPRIQNSNDIVKPNPHIDKISINLDLDGPSEQWFTQFKNSWNLCKFKDPTMKPFKKQFTYSKEMSCCNEHVISVFRVCSESI